MALQSSGAISLANIQTEFGGSNPISISEYYGAAAGVPSSGTISLSDFYGTSAYAAIKSLYLNGSDEYIKRLFPSDGNLYTHTLSLWYKHNSFTHSNPRIFSTLNYDTNLGNSYRADFFISNSGNAMYATNDNAWYNSWTITSAGLADGNWHHIVLTMDTSEISGYSRPNLYIDGTKYTRSGGIGEPYKGFNKGWGGNSYRFHALGNETYTTYNENLNGYITEVHFIDGQSKLPSAFASSGSPIEYTGTYGTNGFRLRFDSNLNDTSGNNNHWTGVNTDSTNYYATVPT